MITVIFFLLIDIVDELENDTADSPHVSSDIIPFLNEHYLRRPITSRLNIWSHPSFWLQLRYFRIYINEIIKFEPWFFRNVSLLDLLGDALGHRSSHSKIAYFYYQSYRVDKNATWLEIPVYNVGLMNIIDHTKHVIYYCLHFRRSKFSR